MPEVTADEFRLFVRYQGLGTPEEVEKRLNKVPALESDNKDQRDQIRDLKTKVVPEGGKVLTPAEATELEAYRALGPPEKVKVTVEKVPTLEADIARRDRETGRDAAAKALGIEGKHLAPFAGSDALTYSTKDEDIEVGGKTEKRSVAYVKDAEGKEHKLADYGKEKWGLGFERLLEAPVTQADNGKRYTEQTGGKGTPGKYDPEAAGKKMAEDTLANKADKSLAFR